jgi:predicted metal-dependent phosphoesterase TrpH
MTHMQETITADFHTHSIYSHDSLMTPVQLVNAALQSGLGKVAVTDHNSIRGALEASEIAPEHVIVGEEIMTSSGEILGLYMTDEIPHRLTPQETIERLRKQGAFISISHPFDNHRSLWKLQELIDLIPFVDAMEVFNARCMNNRYNEIANQFAIEHGLLGTVGSDAHSAREVGGVHMILPDFSDAGELRIALKDATMAGRLASPLVHVDSRWAKFVKKIGK